MKVASSSAHAPSIYEHLSAEEHRLELERTREELRNTKKQLAERDAEILQLKTAHRKLQDALRKKDKDLQNVFGVLRAPQDAELTKKRRTELVERLLMEAQQRVVNAEAVAEERKRELDKLKFSSKFLRYQELDVEIEECYKEIERLRSQLSQYTIVGKLRISKKGGSAMEHGKTSSTGKTMLPRRERDGNQSNDRAVHFREQVVTPIVQRAAVPDAPAIFVTATTSASTKRENFVERTRRRAVEAEYQKQVRLAQLEAECELEENLRILAKREAAAQAEMRRRNSQQERRSSRSTQVAAAITTVVPLGISGAESEAIVEDTESSNAPEASPALFPTEEGAGEPVVRVVEPQPSISEEVDRTMGQLVAEVIATASEVESPDRPPSEFDVKELATGGLNEPKQYDEERFDEGAEDHEVDEVRTKMEEGGKSSTPVELPDDDQELEDGIEDAVVASAASDSEIMIRPNAEVEVEDDEERESQHEEHLETEDPVEEDDLGEDEHPTTNHPLQGFLVDPVNNVQVPSSHTWPSNAPEEVSEDSEDAPKPTEVDSARSVEVVSLASGETSTVASARTGGANDFYEEEYEEKKNAEDEHGEKGAVAEKREVEEITNDTYGGETQTKFVTEVDFRVEKAAEAIAKDEEAEIQQPTAKQDDETNAEVVIEDRQEEEKEVVKDSTTDDDEVTLQQADTQHPDGEGRDKTNEENEQDEEEAVYDTPRSEERDEPVEAESTPGKEMHPEAAEFHNDKPQDVCTEETAEKAVESAPSSEDTAYKEATEPTPSPAEYAVEEAVKPAVPVDVALDDTPTGLHSDDKVTDQETAEQTLHACDDAIVAASELIHRQIDSALAESASALQTPPNDPTVTTEANDLSPAELAMAMDAAARKIQKFWRDMDAKYATPRSHQKSAPANAEPVEIAVEQTPSTVDDDEQTPETPERVESPVVSDTDAAGAEDDDGW